jgi:glycerophosphoryl diester phosphodiesterase
MTLVIAHRGASATHPENTVAAFRAARDLGADWVELDVRRTRDGHLAILHDAHLPDGRPLMHTDRHEVEATVPVLAEALDACTGMGINIEIKNWPDDIDHDPTMAVARGVVAEIQHRACHGDVLVSCFDLATVDAVRELDPAIPTAYLVVDPDGGAAVDVAVAHGHCALHPWDGSVDEALIARAHAAGLAVNTWTVDDPERMRQLVAWGVDGIVTNVPDVARTVVPRR